jgi:hypothetical protein
MATSQDRMAEFTRKQQEHRIGGRADSAMMPLGI